MCLVFVGFAACGDDGDDGGGRSGPELLSLGFEAASNPGLGSDVTATIEGTAFSATVPFGADVTHLVATFVTSDDVTGAGAVTVTVGGVEQQSGKTVNDFTKPVTYTVAAADGTSRDYVVTIQVAPGNAKDINSFSFRSADNDLVTDETATIKDAAIAVTVPSGTEVKALVATFETTGASVKVGDAMQASGTTKNDFTKPVIYTVTAADGSTKDYTVTVTTAAIGAKDLTSFAFRSANNEQLPVDEIATISGTAIAVTVPFGTDVKTLVATFETIGASVAIGETAQVSGKTANDFTKPVAYTVTAADDTEKTFTVAVTIAPDPAITAFSFRSMNNDNLQTDVTATIKGTALAVTVPFGTDATALIATFETSGTAVQIGDKLQVSGKTANDFTKPATYTVIGGGGSKKDVTVTVTVAAKDAKALTAFKFLKANNPKLAADVTGKIDEKGIAVTVPAGTDVTKLIATFETTGASVAVGVMSQVSGSTANDFTSPVTYTVTAADLSKQSFTVTVTVSSNE